MAHVFHTVDERIHGIDEILAQTFLYLATGDDLVAGIDDARAVHGAVPEHLSGDVALRFSEIELLLLLLLIAFI